MRNHKVSKKFFPAKKQSMNRNQFRSLIHQSILDRLDILQEWFLEKSQATVPPFYSSFDIRDSGFKIACVDANLFPAGFNNICQEDQKLAEDSIKKYLQKHYPAIQTILLLAEEHTKNLHYWDNIFIIRSLIEASGYKVVVCVPGKTISSNMKIKTAVGREIEIQLLKETKGDLIISNNDFSVEYELPKEVPCTPPFKMGWLFRKKDHFFKEYNLLTKEFAKLLQIEPWPLQIETQLFSDFDVESPDSRRRLQKSSTEMIDFLNQQQKLFSIPEAPYLFLKNNAGTYGLGVIDVQDIKDLDHWTYKSREKMKASKGHVKKNEILIQEGIPTVVQGGQNESAEPVIYMAGEQVGGGFLRTHKKKDNKMSRNSPGSVYKRCGMRDLEIKVQGLMMENVYSWLAKIGNLALAQEIKHYRR